MKNIFLTIFLLGLSVMIFSQKIVISTLDSSKVEVVVVSVSEKQKLLLDFNGKQDNALRKQWTARTYLLSDKRVLVEFYDGQAVIINNSTDFNKLNKVRFIKTYIDFLKKNIAYKIELTYDEGNELVKKLNPKRLDQFKRESLDFTSFEIYELSTNQILFISTTYNSKSAAIYENIKALASECSDVLNQHYGYMDAASEKFVKGDPLLDFEITGHLVYPADLTNILQNHKLSILETKVYVEQFFGNLYKSENGYYILINEVNQKNGGGDKMGILTARVYQSLEDVRKAQAKYEKYKKEDVKSEHFYQKISDDYGQNFPKLTRDLIDSLPVVLNFDKEQLMFDSSGIEIVDEAIHWSHNNYSLFDKWFPAVLAYYGQCYMNDKKEGKWVMKRDKKNNVIVPHLVLKNGEDAFDVMGFYKDLYEWPIPLQIAGDWDGSIMRMRKEM